jgi:hypothetical protein
VIEAFLARGLNTPKTQVFQVAEESAFDQRRLSQMAAISSRDATYLAEIRRKPARSQVADSNNVQNATLSAASEAAFLPLNYSSDAPSLIASGRNVFTDVERTLFITQ